jgi:hypothetical protein
MSIAKTIIFVDYGQDYIEWDLDEDGFITECRPFNSQHWLGARVKNHLTIEAGDFATIELDDKLTGQTSSKFIVYPVEAVHVSEVANGA